MEIIRSKSIPFKFDLEELRKQLHVRSGTSDSQELERLVNEAQRIAVPRYVYRQAFVTAKGDEYVLINDVRFESRVIRVNLDKAERTFPFVCTCGMELEDWGAKVDDWLMGFWVEGIKEAALRFALDAFFTHLETSYKLGHVSTMSPGSLENWPISQQQPLFQLLEFPGEVRLTDSLLMVPTKSVSGIVFPTDANFQSCQLCPRENCPNRRAPYDETLYEREYCPSQTG
jgi:hypothetical protein